MIFTYNIDSLLEHGVSKVRGKLGVPQHDGGDGMVVTGYGEACPGHLTTESIQNKNL